MLRALAFASLLFASPAWAQAAARVDPARDTTPWSCTINTLHKGGECVFESEAAAPKERGAQANANEATARSLANAVCSVSAKDPRGRRDPALASLCESEFKAATSVCGLDGTAVLLDDRGRFAPEARVCYLRLGEVVQQTQLRAAVASTCCSCLAASHCGAGADACYDNVSRRAYNQPLLQCMRGACRPSCAANLPTQQELQAMDADEDLDSDLGALPLAPPAGRPLPKQHQKTQSHQL